jgi:hypothetical protein
MPYAIHKQGKQYAIINKNTGRVVGHSSSRAKAQKSINARNAASHGAKLGKAK